jgi:hypothetical protein
MDLFVNVVFSPHSGIKFEAFTTQKAADQHLLSLAKSILGKDAPVLQEDFGCLAILAALEAHAGRGYFFDQLTNDLQTEFNAERYT